MQPLEISTTRSSPGLSWSTGNVRVSGPPHVERARAAATRLRGQIARAHTTDTARLQLRHTGANVPHWKRLSAKQVAGILTVLGDKRWGDDEQQLKLIAKLENAGFEILDAKGERL